MNRFLMMGFGYRGILRMAEDGAGAGDAPPAGDPPAPAAAPAGDPPAATPAAPAAAPAAPAPWFQSERLPEDTRTWLDKKGMTKLSSDDALLVAIKGHQNAEKLLGKGVDAIMDRPAKDQPYADWARANAAMLGLPDKAEGYTAPPPEFWPKDAKWDAELEGRARDVAFAQGVSPAAHRAYVDLFAQKMKDMGDEADTDLNTAKAQMMADLEKDYGAQTDARITLAKQAAQAVAEKAGLDSETINRIGTTLSKETGDAGVIRFLAAIGDMMGEDSGVAIGKGGSLTMTPADARAELARFQSADGEYGKAHAAGDAAKLRELTPKRAQLAKLAAG